MRYVLIERIARREDRAAGFARRMRLGARGVHQRRHQDQRERRHQCAATYDRRRFVDCELTLGPRPHSRHDKRPTSCFGVTGLIMTACGSLAGCCGESAATERVWVAACEERAGPGCTAVGGG